MVTLAALIFSCPAFSQSVPLQGGPWTAGHMPMYSLSGGSQPVIQDGGTASGGAAGTNPSELGITIRGTGTAPYANQGNGVLNTNICDYDAPTNNSTGYHYLCLSPNAQGGGILAYGAGGGASQLPLYFNINGTNYEFPAALSGVAGPATSVVGDLACWNNTSGTLLDDCGTSVLQGPNSSTVNDIATFNNASGSLIKDSGISLGSQSPNLVLATPGSGSGAPTFRSLVGADLPAPTVSALGGIFQSAAGTNQIVTGLNSTGALIYSSLPTPTVSLLGGVKSSSASGNEFATGIDTSGNITYGTPSFADLLSTANTWTALQTYTAGFLANQGTFGSNTDPNPGYSLEAFPTTGGVYSSPAFNFNDQATSGFNFPDASTHFGTAITGNSASSGTGSYEALFVQQYCQNRSTSAYCTGAQEKVSGVQNASGNAGNFTGNNPYVYIPTGMTPTTVVGEEINTELHSSALAKEGLRIADLGSTADGDTCTGDICAGIDITKLSTAYGYTYGLRFNADSSGTDSGFPVASGGTLIKSNTTSLTLNAGIDMSGMLGGFTEGALLLPPGGTANGSISWGSAGGGGLIKSQTTSGAGKILFANGDTAFQFGSTNPVIMYSDGHVGLGGYVQLYAGTSTTLPTCNSSIKGGMAYITDGPSSPTYNAILSGGGSQALPVFCDGSNWRFH